LTRIYCTLFDKNYLLQGVALHRSLVRCATNFRLYALCTDATAYALIKRMESETLRAISVDELLTPEISAVRARTTHGQFCWVCQPLVCEFILNKFGVDQVTYLEADSLFFSDPEALFTEIGDAAACLVPHNFSSEFDNSATAGNFCVQFNAFRNNDAARELLAYWRSNCFKYDKALPKAYPGQTSLDDWPSRFAGVHVIQHPGAGVAPWNIQKFKLEMKGSTPCVDGVLVVFYHFHQYGRYKNGAHELGSYPLSREVIDCFYRPYVTELRQAEIAVRAIDSTFTYRREYADHSTLLDALRSFSGGSLAAQFDVAKRRLRGRYNIYPDKYFA
jgi:hypothetical protein